MVTWRMLQRWMALAIAFFALSLEPAMAQRGDVTIGVRLEPPHLDPTAGAAASISEITYANLFEGLVRIDRSGNVQPALAHHWDISEDGRTYTFHLRTGVLFHDGSAFDAEDAKFSLDRAIAENSINPQKALLEAIEAVEQIDAGTLRIFLRMHDSRFLSTLGQPALVMVAKETADTNKTNPNGTGPFRLARWSKGDRIDLVQNERYWGEKPALKRATFRVIDDPSAAYAALMSGNIDAFTNYPAPENIQQFQGDQRFQVVIGNTEGKTLVAINNGRKPLDDVRVRRAISHAINRAAVIEGALYGYAQPIGSHYVPQDKGYVDLTGRYPYDPDAARALLEEAGISDLQLRLVLPPIAYARRSAEIIAAQLRHVGIQVEIANVEWAQWLSDVFSEKRYDLSIVSHVEADDLDIYARDDYYFDYQSSAYQALYASMVAERDESERLVILHKLQEKIAEDAVNGFLFMLPKVGIWDIHLKGLWENAPVPANDLTEVRWEY